MKKTYVIDLDIWLDDLSSYVEDLEKKLGEVVKITIPCFDVKLKESEVDLLAETYASILRNIKRDLKEVCLHLSTLNAITTLIAIKMKGEGWEVYNRNIQLPECIFSTIETSEDLLVDTYKAFFPLTDKFC